MISAPNTCGDLCGIVLCEGQAGVLPLKKGSPSMMLLCAEPGARYPRTRQRETEASTHTTPPEAWAFSPHFLQVTHLSDEEEY